MWVGDKVGKSMLRIWWVGGQGAPVKSGLGIRWVGDKVGWG